MSDPAAENDILFQLLRNRQTTRIKQVLILGFNLLAFFLAWGANGWALPDLTLPLYADLLLLFPGRLQPIGSILLTIFGILLSWSVLRYLLIFNLAAFIPLLFGVRFVQQLYQFESFSLAFGYLMDIFLETSYYYITDVEDEKELPAGYGSCAFGRRKALVVNGKLKPAKGRLSNRSIAWAGGSGQVEIPPEYAVQLEKGGRLSRSVGPSQAKLGRYEKVYKLVNLRQIVRTTTTTALTRDGIPVTVEITVHCRLAGGNAAASLETSETPFPFTRQSIRKLTLNTLASDEGLQPWEDRASAFAGDIFNDVIAGFRLDEIFEPLDDVADPRYAIQETVRRTLRAKLRNVGVEVTELWLGQFQLPTEVTEQYIEYWRADWQRQDRVRAARGKAEAIRKLGRARAHAQQRTIETLVAGFETARRAHPDFPPRQLLALRLINALEELYKQTGKEEQALEKKIARLRRVVSPEEGQPPEGTPHAT